MAFPFDNSYARLPDAFYMPVNPTPVDEPQLIQINRELADELGLDADWLESPEGVAVLAGNKLAEGADPIAMAYSGHQFGGFSPQLGDGRAILLGEVVGKDGVRRDVQLKGSGPTPFSRRGDGRSALGPVLREYIVSEAMQALGVPTTRALAAIASGEMVRRERMEPGGVFTRVAQSHIRIGTFQWFAARQDLENLKVLADYAIDRHYPEARESVQPYRAFFEGVIKRQAELIAQWMQLGFIHGVMNTDNMSVSGETIDYGPCAFMDEFHSMKTFSSIDQHGRYAYTNQSVIGRWNLTRLAETLIPLFDDESEKAVEFAEAALDEYPKHHQAALEARLTAKIGLTSSDQQLLEKLLKIMENAEADFTLVFRNLTAALESGSDEAVAQMFEENEGLASWLSKWRSRINEVDREEALEKMRRANPVFIPRNHRVEEAIQACYRGDFEPFHRLNRALAKPFEEQPEFAEYESAPTSGEVVTATFCGT